MNFVVLLFFLIVMTVGAFTIQSADDDLDDMDYDEDNQGDSLIPPAIVLRSEQGEPQQTVQIPDQDGNFQPMTRIGVRECRNNATHYDAAKYVKCYLYSKNGTRTQFHFDQLNSIELAGFMRHLPTTILVHGWLGSSDSVVIDPLAKALLEQEHNNVIAVDWEEGASTFIYPVARYRVPKVAAVVAKLIDNLVLGLDADVDWIGIIGHSLGAHIAGIAGKKVTAGKIGYIVGLDPASPLFRVKKPNHRLSAEDAQYVEIIHTNGKALGFFRNIGQADYYPNGGVAQPGCGISFTCSHQRAVDFFKESLSTRNNYASRCNDLDNLGPSCTRASSAAFGGLVWRASKPAGVYYITTSAKEPFLRDNSAGVAP
ncbi:lipase member H-like isoform X2 [Anopheles cruzii]|uniref:lipase member H-like isoform X2 n=1 Tax=Anopheles cruzii TaxID=68878 RepID=UPI0022EC70F1|nr:lipase member H-like isoform X2 [Anopheles cruzii]